jgi:hypothetical protein
MLEYPSDLPAAARARIERELAETERAFVTPNLTMFVLGGRDATPRLPYDPASDPVQMVLRVFTTAVTAYCEAARTKNWPADILRDRTDEYRAWLIARIYQHYQGKHVTLDAFTGWVFEELRSSPCWVQLQHTIGDLATRTQGVEHGRAERADPQDDTPLFSLKEVAERFNVNPVTLRRAAAAGKVTLRKVGKNLKMSRAEIDRLLATGKYPKDPR